MNSAPRSTTAPSPNGTDQTRPPTRSRASRIVTSAPPLRRVSAAARPANPAPITHTRFISLESAHASRCRKLNPFAELVYRSRLTDVEAEHHPALVMLGD